MTRLSGASEGLWNEPDPGDTVRRYCGHWYVPQNGIGEGSPPFGGRPLGSAACAKEGIFLN